MGGIAFARSLVHSFLDDAKHRCVALFLLNNNRMSHPDQDKTVDAFGEVRGQGCPDLVAGMQTEQMGLRAFPESC